MPTIEDMIDFVNANELTKANGVFNELLQDKMNQAIDQEKIAVAATIFNGAEESDDDLELDDEDFEDLDEDEAEEDFEEEYDEDEE